VAKAKVKAKKSEKEGCDICEREKTSENYCKYHEKAYHNVMEAFADWEKAYSKLSFKEYLQKVIENPATGIWAKEVAEDLSKREESKN